MEFSSGSFYTEDITSIIFPVSNPEKIGFIIKMYLLVLEEGNVNQHEVGLISDLFAFGLIGCKLGTGRRDLI